MSGERPAILFYSGGVPGTLPPAYGLDPEDAATIVGGVDLALAAHISTLAADLVTHYAHQEQADRDSEAYFDAVQSRRRADEWLICHEEATFALSQIFQARAN